MKQKCREEGEKITGVEKARTAINIAPLYEYTYSGELQTCLIYHNYGTLQWVSDAFTNEILISYDYYFDETALSLSGEDDNVIRAPHPNMVSSLLEFMRKKTELFTL